MEPTYLALYRGFEFQCSPQRLDTGEFAPRLVIYDTYESLSLEIPMAAPATPFQDPTAAAHQAFAQGRLWVDSGFGELPAVDIGDAAATPHVPLMLPR